MSSQTTRYGEWLNRSHERPQRLLGFGASMVFHSVGAVCLSVLVIGTSNDRFGPTLEMKANQADLETLEVDSTSLFELVDDVPAVEVGTESSESTVLSDLENLSLPLALPGKTIETKSSSQKAVGETRSTTAGLNTEPVPLVTAIQSRVSKAGGRKGEVQFALTWKDVNDVDLHVIAPSGEHIAHTHRRSRCGGMLDVDMNVDGESDEPVENVRWLSKAPWGRYTILVNFFKLNPNGRRRPRRQSPYQLLAQLGDESIIREGVVGFGATQVGVWRFQYVPASWSSYEREAMLKQLTSLQQQEEQQAAPMLESAKAASGTQRNRLLQQLVMAFPHTDAAIEALQLIDGEVIKRSSSSSKSDER